MTGSGTQADPYIISDVDDLQAIQNNLDAYYELANDIDASATSGWNVPPLTIKPVAKDNTLQRTFPDTNYGDLQYDRINDRGYFAPYTYTNRSILEFDLSEIPPGATLISATLRLKYHYKTSSPYVDPVGKTVWAYKLTRTDWLEAEATWNSYKTGSNWAVAGGDYVTSSPAGDSAVVPASYSLMTWDVLAIVQDAYDGSIAAEFLIKFETEDLVTGYSSLRFASKEYSWPEINAPPELVVTYSGGNGGNGGAGFAPISLFTGSLDGKGYKVDSLFINREHPGGEIPVAFINQFGYGEPRVVKNLGLTNVNITAITGPVASLIGYNAGTITNCYTTGTLLAGGGGGFVNQNFGTIEDCYTGCNITATAGYAGGFAQENSKIISRCYSTGDVIAKYYAGGFVRINYFAGGVIQDCYCRGNVTSTNNYPVGGFIETNFGGGVIDNCYSTSALITTGTKGGFCRNIGGIGSVVTNCFWDIETSGTETSDGGTGKTTAQMKAKATFKEAGWNFKTIWNMLATVNSRYPCLCNVTGNCPTAEYKGNPNIDQLIYQHIERIDR